MNPQHSKNWEDYISTSKSIWEEASLPKGHQERFLEKLKASKEEKNQSSHWYKYLAYAAGLALVVSIGATLFFGSLSSNDGFSPEMAQSKIFYSGIIESEYKKLEAAKNKETQSIINDGMTKLQALDNEYQRLETELKNNDGDSRIIQAMIQNYRLRIDLLAEIQLQIENLKKQNNE